MAEEILLGRHRPVQPEEGVVLHAGLPQVLASTVADHVESQQCFSHLMLVVGGEVGGVVSHAQTISRKTPLIPSHVL